MYSILIFKEIPISQGLKMYFQMVFVIMKYTASYPNQMKNRL